MKPFPMKIDFAYLRKCFRLVGLVLLFLCISLFAGQAEVLSVAVNLDSAKQIIRGFGGMNCPAWIDDLTAEQAEKAFGSGPGQIGLTLMRMRIPNDKSKFSLEVPTAVRAKAHGATLMASPWSPPASMKTNGNTTGGSLKPEAYAGYAAHLRGFCDFMTMNGAPLYAISIQNEPDIRVSYESCDWTPGEMITFLKTSGINVGPAKLMAPESYKFSQGFSDPILNDANAESRLDIIAGHVYGGGRVDYPLARQKGKELWMTEHLTNNSDWSGALATAKEIHDCMVANYSAYLWWYIRRGYGLLGENGNVSPRGYVMSQFAKFIRPGYVRVNATSAPSADVHVTAYKKGGSVVIVVINRSGSTQGLAFSLIGTSVTRFEKYTTSSVKKVNGDGSQSVSGGAFIASVDASSITTFVGEGATQVAINPSRKGAPRAAIRGLSGNRVVIIDNGRFIGAGYDLLGKFLDNPGRYAPLGDFRNP